MGSDVGAAVSSAGGLAVTAGVATTDWAGVGDGVAAAVDEGDCVTARLGLVEGNSSGEPV